MGKFYDEIGYAMETETSPGVWENVITTRKYFGEEVRNVSKIQSTDTLNDNLDVNNQLSIVADPFAYKNFSTMRYVNWMGTLWKINSVEVKRPRLILTIGGVYNGEA